MSGKNIKIARIRRDLTQWDVARQTGIKNYRLSLIECNRVEPTREEQVRLFEVLGLPTGGSERGDPQIRSANQ